MDPHTLDVIDFPRIRNSIAEAARSPQGADACRGIEPFGSLEAARRALDELQALAEADPVLGPPPTDGMERIEPDLEAVRKEGTCLEVDRLLAVRNTIETCHRVHEYLENLAFDGSLLGGYADRMRPLYSLADRFARTFGPRGEVLDDASPVLRDLRAESRRLKDRIIRILEAVLRDSDMEPAVQEDFITLRGNRYVIPLRTDFRGYLKGIVHDRSRTGATFFVEPLEVVELNNQLGFVREEEETEIRRILAEVTDQIRNEMGAIRTNMDVAAHLDALGARLRFAHRLRAVRPELSPAPGLEIRQARHPLLVIQGEGDVVPIDLHLGADSRLLLITGANAGGKTVALKTTGLMVMMARCGLFLPADEGSRVGWFDGIYADIGDEQDIDRHLSTFSAHIARIRHILNAIGRGCLVLLDELGAGTDPTEGVALAMAVLQALLDRGSFVLGTTHLAGLKAFAYAKREAQNAAVAFDPETGRPLYRLVYGQAGASNALEVAERLGLPGKIIEQARSYAVGGGEAGTELLREFELARDLARRSSEESEALRQEWERRLREQEVLVEEARRERDSARLDARREAREMIEQARRQLNHTIREFARGEVGQQQAEAAVREAEETIDEGLRTEVPETVCTLPDLQPGVWVHVTPLRRQGVVEAIEPGGRKVVVRVGTLRVTLPPEDLRDAGDGGGTSKGQRPRLVGVDADRGPPDIVVVGCSVEEALAQVDKALDRALLAGVEGFRVVHGHGTGALRRAVREHLEGAPHVSGTRSERAGASTWVELD